jgi:sialic acid synthase
LRTICIDGKLISDSTDCFLVAEIGHNHQGSLQNCMDMFKAAKLAGASAVKLQKRDNKSLFTKKMYNQSYNSPDSYGATYGLHREALEFNEQELRILKEYSEEIGITLFATPFDFHSADLLAKLDMPAFKLASGDITNHPLIEHIASFHKPIILSTGGAALDEVNETIDLILCYHSEIAILQCTTAYPVKDDEVNLSVITTYARIFPNLVIGYSGHDLGTTMSLAAFILGARIIEKHFTLDKNLPGNDHKLSLIPSEFLVLAQELKRLHLALGNGVKDIYASELPARKKMGKKLVVSRNLSSGHVITHQDILIKSPGDGLSPSFLYSIIGKKLKKDLLEEEDIYLEYLEY